MSSLVLEILTFENGERYPVLVDEAGVPHFYVTLWVTSRLRSTGKTLSTITNKIYQVKRLLEWEKKENKHLFREFQKGEFLNLNEIESLRAFASVNLHSQRLNKNSQRKKTIKNGKVVVSQELIQGNGNSHLYNTMTSITAYLVFLAQLARQFNSTPESNREIEDMERLLKASRPKAKGSYIAKRHLDVPRDLLRDFMRIADHNHPNNPFKDESIRFRNHLMFLLLEHLGIRKGEMLSIRLSHLMLHGSDKHIWVMRTHDDVYDRRSKQPVTKTKERKLAISSYIAKQVDHYIINYRSKVSNSKKHPYLFVTHRAGLHQGYPISNSSFDNTIMPLMKSVDSRFSLIYPHFFRHDWNERFSESVDKKNSDEKKLGNQISADKEAKMRKHQMGHQLEASSNIYNERHITRKANELCLEEQEFLEHQKK